MKKMFVFDYDGTYYRDESELKDNIQMMEKVRKQGHLLVIATGRSYQSFIKEVKKYNIKYDYLILASGALLLDKDDHILSAYPMDISMVKSVDKLIEPYHARLKSQIYIDDFMNSETLSKLNQVLKMSYTFSKHPSNYDIQSAIQDYTNNEFKAYVVVGTTVDYLEIISSKTNKCEAILDLQSQLDDKYDVVTAGDSENDVEMLIEFDGYLMPNHDPNLDDFKLRTLPSIQAIIEKELG